MKYLSMQAMLEADHQKLERTREARRARRRQPAGAGRDHGGPRRATRPRSPPPGSGSCSSGSRRTTYRRLADAVAGRLGGHRSGRPADGVVIARAVNPGQVVGAGQELFVVADLSTVWVIGDLYEKDFALVRVGSEADGDGARRGPSARPARSRSPTSIRGSIRRRARRRCAWRSRTRGGELRLGMYVTLSFASRSGGRVDARAARAPSRRSASAASSTSRPRATGAVRRARGHARRGGGRLDRGARRAEAGRARRDRGELLPARGGGADALRWITLDLAPGGKVYPLRMERDGLLIGEVADAAARAGRRCGSMRRGDLPPSRRTPSGYRVYGADALAVLAFVRQAQRLGFTLGEIKQIVAHPESGGSACSHVREWFPQGSGDGRAAEGSDRSFVPACKTYWTTGVRRRSATRSSCAEYKEG